MDTSAPPPGTPVEGSALDATSPPGTAPVPAWPFLVARGRHRGYRVVLAPEVLIDGQEYGVLDDTVVPGDQQDRATVIQVTTRSGRPLTVVHATHLVTAAEIAEPGTEPSSRAPRDQHSRPLQLIYGYVCEGRMTPEIRQEDLRTTRDAALKAYRAFLSDEDGFTVEPSPAFTVPSRPTTAPPPRTARHGDPHAFPTTAPPPRTAPHAFPTTGAPRYAAHRGDPHTSSSTGAPRDPGGIPDWDPGGWEFPARVSPAFQSTIGAHDRATLPRRPPPSRRNVLVLYTVAGLLGTVAVLLYLVVWSGPSPSVPVCPSTLPTAVREFPSTPPTAVREFPSLSPTPLTPPERETAPSGVGAQGSGTASATCVTKDKKDEPEQ
jgi:hypothetical protein